MSENMFHDSGSQTSWNEELFTDHMSTSCEQFNLRKALNQNPYLDTNCVDMEKVTTQSILQAVKCAVDCPLTKEVEAFFTAIKY